MAKIRVMSNQRRVGRVGDTTYYVRDGEQIARQSKNNSNYGTSASRTEAQQLRRVKWSNLVNCFKVMKDWQPKAYDYKKQGQTDYNIFMALNINSARIALTKDMAQNGCACWDVFQVSRGSLAPIGLQAGANVGDAVTDIALTITVTSTTTIGALSSDIIANNPMFKQGDNIAIVGFWTIIDERGYPYSGTVYRELTLNTSSTATLAEADLWNYISKSSGGFLQLDSQTVSGGACTHMVAIHTRKDSVLQVSTQSTVAVDDRYSAQFMTSEWIQECIDSYGVNDEVPLDPSFSYATISQVTANGSAIENMASLTGSQDVDIIGSNLNSSEVKLTFNGIEYTPLEQGPGYMRYLIGDNGTVRIFKSGILYMTFSVSGVVIPEDLPSKLAAMLRPDNVATWSYVTGSDRLVLNSANCINYPHKPTTENPYFLIVLQVGDGDTEDFTLHNCTINNRAFLETGETMNLSPVDADKPCYIEYKGFIIAVFNYSN